MNSEKYIAGWLILLAAAFPVSIAGASLLYFPLLGLYGLCGWWTFRRWPPQWGLVEKAFVSFWIISLLSALCGTDLWFSRVRLGKDLYFLILVLLTAYLAKENRTEKLMKVFMVSTIVTAVFGIVQRVIGVNQSDNAGGVFFHMPEWLAHAPRSVQNHLSMVHGRVVGTRAHPLTYAEGLLFALAYTLSHLASPKKEWGKWALAQGVILLALVFSQSRGPWIAAVGMVFVTCLLYRKLFFYKRLALIYLPIALCFLSPSLRARAFSITDKSYEPNSERLEMWRAGSHMIQDHPLLGIGTGTMHLVSPKYQTAKRQLEGPWSHLHNMYVNTAAERGLLGLLAFITFVLLLATELWQGYRVAVQTHSVEAEIMILTGLLGLIGWLLSGFTETVNHDSNVLMMFYFVMGLSLATARNLRRHTGESR